MAMSDAEISILIKARDEATRVFDKIKGSAGALQGSLGKVASIAGGFVLAKGIIAAPGFLIDAAQAAADDAASVAKLQQAVINSGATWDQYKGQLDAVILAGQKKGFTDDQTRDALALLVAQTGSATEATHRYAMAQDLARGANIDVFTASKLLGKVTEENVNVLNRYGIVVAKGASETELFGQIQQRFGGQADAFAQSTAGRMAHLRDQMRELKEQLGAALLPVMGLLVGVLADKVAPAIGRVVQIANDFSNLIRASLAGDVAQAAELFNRLPGPLQQVALWLGKNKDAIEGFIREGAKIAKAIAVDTFEGWKTILIALAPKLQEFGQFLADHKPLLLALVAAVAVLVAVLIGVPALIALLIVAGGLLVAHWGDIKAKAADLWQSFDERFHLIAALVKFVFEDIVNWVTLQFNILRGIFRIAMAIIHGDWGEAWAGIKQLALDVWDGIHDLIALRVALIRDIIVMGLTFAAGVAVDVMGKARDGIINAWDAIQSGVTRAVDWIIGKIQELIDKLNIFDDLPGFGKIAGVVSGARGLFGRAHGGPVPAGAWAVVGEQGPELVHFPSAANVYSNAESTRMAGANTTIVNNYYIQAAELHGDAAAGFAALAGFA